jgi:hypothetical protein
VLWVPSRIVISTINFLGCRLVVLSDMARVNMKHRKLADHGVLYAIAMMHQDLLWAAR